VNDNWTFVGAAFAITWAVLLGYLVHVHRTLRRARALLESATSSDTQ
jgi:CcmD family protein